MGMSDIREVLEKQFEASAPEEQSPLEEIIENNGEQFEQPAVIEAVDLYLDAPKAYKKEYTEAFRTLTPEMRRYLHERESEAEKGFSRLNNSVSAYKWVDEEFGSRAEKAKAAGFNTPKEYYSYLMEVEDALEKNPKAVLDAFSQVYGGGDVDNQHQDWMLNKLSQMESQYNNFNQYISKQQQAENEKFLSDFVNTKNEDGSLKYPLFEKVRDKMAVMLQKGVCEDMEEAYENAVWSNPELRKGQMAASQQEQLKTATAAAEKAKNASFAPSGKAKAPPTGGGSLRETLEKQFAAMDD